MTMRQLGKGIQVGFAEDQYVGVVIQVDQGDVLTCLSPSQALVLSQVLADKAYELLNKVADEDPDSV